MNRLGLPDIAFAGKAGSGKTLAADFLVSEFGYTKLSFAAPVKRFEAEIFDGPPSRERQVKLGRAIREIDGQALVRHLLTEAEAAWGPFVVDDLRYPAEWDALKGDSFTVIRVTAGRAHRIDRLRASGKLELLDHLDDESETALDGREPDRYLLNNSIVEDAYERLLEIISRERRRR